MPHTRICRHLTLAGLAAAIGITLPAAAQQPSAGQMPQQHMQLFSRIDRDKDGTITKDEYKAYRDQMFARMDTNKDNAITKDEYMAQGMMGGMRSQSGAAGTAGQRPMGMMGQQQMGQPQQMQPQAGQPSPSGQPMHGREARFTALDTNKDGVISKSEWDAETDRLFSARDRNKDGKLTPDEMGPMAMMRSQRQ